MADTDYLAASDDTGNAALMHVTSPRTAGATIIQVDTVTGVPAFFIGTWGTLGADGFITQASARDFFGHVNAGTLVIDKMAPGNTDAGNTSGQVVVIKPATPTQNLIAQFIKNALNLFGQGELLNGQIVPTISSNNLILSIKTLNNVDPSTSDVVYVRIGNTIKTITAALSVTLAAGTNWFGKGSVPFATVPTTFFVYLGYNATDGVTLGVSSSPSAVKYSEFSTTNTDWTYAKISTITNAAANDVYENVGRFNAILGVSATYLWTLPAGNFAISQPSRAIINYPCRFYVRRNAALTVTGFTILQTDTKIHDIGNNVDVVTNKGRFTAPVAGFYSFTAIWQSSLAGSDGAGLSFNKNGSRTLDGTYISVSSYVTTTGTAFLATADNIFLAAGDYIEPVAYSNAAVAMDVSANERNFFQGHIINPV